MSINTKNLLTDPKRFFLEPSTSAQRQYEALRGFFIEELPSAEAAQRFGYTPGSFRVLVHDFRHDPDPQFFLPPHRGPDSAPKSDPLRESIITLRKQNFSLYDIRDLLREEGHALGTSTIAAILKEEGFSSFCLSSPRSHSRTSFKKRTSQVPRRYQRTTPCAPFWHSSCSETQDTAMS